MQISTWQTQKPNCILTVISRRLIGSKLHATVIVWSVLCSKKEEKKLSINPVVFIRLLVWTSFYLMAASSNTKLVAQVYPFHGTHMLPHLYKYTIKTDDETLRKSSPLLFYSSLQPDGIH